MTIKKYRENIEQSEKQLDDQRTENLKKVQEYLDKIGYLYFGKSGEFELYKSYGNRLIIYTGKVTTTIENKEGEKLYTCLTSDLQKIKNNLARLI